MAISLDFNLETDKGQDISVMSQIIEKRTQELGETTNQSCVAMVINILKSFRTDTKQARLNEKANLQITDVSEKYYPSFSKHGKGTKAQRVLRSGKDGNRITPEKVTWICSNYFKGQKVYTYEVIDTISSDKKYEYLLVADDQKSAKEYAKQRHKNRIKRNRNLAKYALGLAMHKVHNAQNPQDEVNEDTKKIGSLQTYVDIRETGYNNGTMNIHVEDNLRYATDALKNGESEVQTTIQKALNKMIGYINHRLHQKGIYDDLQIPLKDMTQ